MFMKGNQLSEKVCLEIYEQCDSSVNNNIFLNRFTYVINFNNCNVLKDLTAKVLDVQFQLDLNLHNETWMVELFNIIRKTVKNSISMYETDEEEQKYYITIY